MVLVAVAVAVVVAVFKVGGCHAHVCMQYAKKLGTAHVVRTASRKLHKYRVVVPSQILSPICWTSTQHNTLDVTHRHVVA